MASPEKVLVVNRPLLTEIEVGGRPASDSNPLSVKMGFGDITTDAWGHQKVVQDNSMFHGLFTFSIPTLDWLLYENGAEVATSANIVSTDGAAVITGNSTKASVTLESRRCIPYQPNRGVHFATALWCPSKTAAGVREWGMQTAEAGVFFRLKSDGKLYAVLRSHGVETKEEEIDTTGVTGFDVEKGNVYDIQYQWRGVGNYKFFINLQEVHVFNNLGTLTALSMSNPTLPAVFKATRTSADVSIYVGCVDISSEGGSDLREEYGSAYSQAVSTTGADKPILVLYNPLLIGSVTNTRTVHLHDLHVTCDKKCVVKVWKTRTAAAITGATFVAGYGGAFSFVQSDSTDMNAGAVRATAVTVANLRFITAINLQANTTESRDLSHNGHVDVDLVRGDYLVVTTNATTGSSDVTVTWGEEV